MHAWFARIGRCCVRRRWSVAGIWLVLAVSSVHFLPNLAAAVNNDSTQFLPSGAPSNVAARLAAPFTGRSNNDDAFVVAATSNHRALTASDRRAVDRLATLAGELPHARVAFVAELSGDRQAALVEIRADLSQASNRPDVLFVRGLRALFGRVGAPHGLELHTAGNLAVTADQAGQAGGIGARTEYLSIAMIVLLLLGVFRSFLAPLATLLPAVVVLEAVQPLVAELATHGLHISSITQLLLIVLVLGAGTDYGLFLVFRTREEIRRGRSHRDAIVRALERVGESITFSAATVMVALLSLLLASFGIYHGLAVPLAIGIGVTLVAGLTLVPAVLAIFGRLLFWPAAPTSGERTSGAWGRAAGRVVDRPVLALLAGCVVLSTLAGFSLLTRASGFGGGISAPRGSDSAAGQALLVEHFSLASSNPLQLVLAFDRPVWSHPGELAVAGAQLQSSQLFSSLIAPLDPNGTPIMASELARLHSLLGNPLRLPSTQSTTGAAARVSGTAYQAFRATGLVIAPNGRTVQYLASQRVGGPDSNAAISGVPAVRAVVADVARRVGAVAQGVAGDAPSLYDVRSISGADLLRVVPVAIVVIGLLLALLLRSLVAPMFLIVSVGLSYLASLGTAVIVFEEIGAHFGLSFILPFLMFVFLLALGEDYNILVMSRIREEARTLPLRDAVVRAIEVTGTTVTSAGMVLAGTFLVFAVAGASGAEGAQIQEIGIGLAVGVVLDTFAVRTILVPAMVVVLGRWTWWPSTLHRAIEVLPQVDAVLEDRADRLAPRPIARFEPLETPRTRLEPITFEVARAIVAGDLSGLDPGEGWPHEDTLDALGEPVEDGHAPGWLVVLDGQVIGDCGTHGPVAADGSVEIGYGLAGPYRGRGLGSEIVVAISDWLIARPEVCTVRASVVADNLASRRVLEKAGFAGDGVGPGGELLYRRTTR